MSMERWKRIDALFQRALDMPAPERRAFLDEACRDEPQIRAEVEALLESALSEEDFFGGLADRAGLGDSRQRQAAIEDVHEEIEASIPPAGSGPGADRSAEAEELLSRLEPALAGRYEISRALGAGGMAVVFLARDVRHERSVALKVMKAGVVGSAGAGRFLREIRIAANLQHPHLLPLHDSGEVAGLLYYVMPYVEGESLEERLRRERQLPVGEAVRIALEVADGLAHAHERGLIHRDIKPANVMLSGGHALVADFGIARAMDEAGTEKLTSTGLAIGTPSYMSPEQWEAATSIDGRADQYALACMLYEMLVGEPPFTGPTPQVILARHALDEVPSIRTARPSVPPGIDGVIRRAMAKVPGDRYPDLGAFSEATRRAIGGEITEPSLLPGSDPGRGRRAGSRWIAWSVATVLALVAAAIGVRFMRPGAAVARDARVVVGYFVDETGDPSFAQVGKIAIDRITEGLLDNGAMDVVPPPTALQATRFVEGEVARGAAADPIRELAAETGSRMVVSGSYDVRGDSLVLAVTVSDVDGSGAPSLVDRVEGRSARGDPMEAIEAARDGVLGVFALARDDRFEATRAPTYGAYLAFSRGLDDYIDRRFAEAIPRLRQATEIDPSFVVPLVYAGLSYVNIGERARADSLVRVLEDMEGSLSAYHRHWLDYLAAQLRGHRNAALEAMREAAAEAPGSKAVYNRAYVALQVNRPQEALDALLSLDPDRGPMRGWLPYWYVRLQARHMLGGYAEELADARSVRQRRPNARYSQQLVATALIGLGDVESVRALADSVAGLRLESDPIRPVVPGSMYHELALELQWHGHEEAARAFFAKAEDAYARWEATYPDSANLTAYLTRKASLLHDAGRFEEALSLVEELERRSGGDVRLRGWRGVLLAALGRDEQALDIDDGLAGADLEGGYGEIPLARARIHARLGDLDRAIAFLQAAFDEGLPQPMHPDNNFRAFWHDQRLRALFVPAG